MPTSSFRAFSRLLVPVAAVLVLTGQLFGQGARPGSAGRGTATGTGTRATTTRATTTSGARSANGQRQYRSNTELGDAMIQIDPETRSLVIVTDEETHAELQKVIANLDKPKPQVLIKVVFLEITYNKDLDVGVQASYTANMRNPTAASTGSQVVTSTQTRGTATDNGQRTTTSTLTTALGDAANLGQNAILSSVFGAPAVGSFLRLTSDDWSATLHALASRGKLEVLSRPSIMARNNQEAVIVVGSEVPFITNSRITDQGQTINTIQYDNVGIILRVTPFITSDGTVEMIVAPEISTLTDQTVPISNNASAPVIAKRSAETVVVTPHGQTVVIGGLMETQKREIVQKIPLLGDIPFLGIPFRRTIKADQKRELLIFLTPYIVNDKAGIAREASGEMAKTELVEKAFTESDMVKYLDGLPLPSEAAPAPSPAAAPEKPVVVKTKTVTTKPAAKKAQAR